MARAQRLSDHGRCTGSVTGPLGPTPSSTDRWNVTSRAAGGSAAGTLGERHPALERIGARHGCSPQRAAIAWLRTLAPDCIPIPGGRAAARVLDSVAGGSLVLRADDRDDVATLVREAPR